MKLPSVTKKFWIVVVAVAVVASFLAFYLLIYVKDRESYIVAKNYRALNRLGKNILELRNNYEISIARHNAGMALNVGIDEQRAYLYFFELFERDEFELQGIKVSSGPKKSKTLEIVELSSDTAITQQFHISAADFLRRSNLASTPFNDFFLIRIFHFPEIKTKTKGDSVSFGIAYQTFSNRIEIKSLDSLIFLHHGLESIPLQDIVLAGTPYKIFSHR